MALQTPPIRRFIGRLFPRKYLAPLEEVKEWELFPEEIKKDLALEVLSRGELSLLQGKLSALSFFETAMRLDPDNPELWYRQGLSFFEYGSEEGKEQALLAASRYLKFATQLNPDFFDAWVAWGNVLLQLGLFHLEHHFLLEAKEKYQRAFELVADQPQEVLAELYWDYGNVWAEIAQYSGEALDLRLAIEAFQTALSYREKPEPELLNDCGKAHLELGLLINETGLYRQAVDYFLRAVNSSPQYVEGWVSLAEGYSQLYLNTMDGRYLTKASDCFVEATKRSPQDLDTWLDWAQILGESGRLNSDPKLLRLSIEKCAKAALLDPKNSLVIAQWVESLSFLGFVTGRLDLITEAENKVLKAIDAFPDDPEVWHAYGICCIAFGRYYEDPDYYEAAIENLQIGLSIDRTSAEHWHTLGIAHKLYAELTDDIALLQRAKRFFARAIDLKPCYPPLFFDAASSLLRLSELADDLPSLEKAILYFKELLQMGKDVLLHHPEWLYEYACALEWLGDYSNEKKHFSHAIELFSFVLLVDPDFPHTHFRMALCYVELAHLSGDVEFYRKALHFFRLSTRKDAENDQIWLEWGICLIHLAHHTLETEVMNSLYWDAEQKLIRAGRLGNTNAYYNLACLYSILGYTREAMELVHKALYARALPPLEEMLDDEWLDNLVSTEAFAQFVNALEMKLQAREDLH